MNKPIDKRLAALESRRGRRVLVADDAREMSDLTLAEARRLARPQDTIIVVEWAEPTSGEE